MHTSQYGHLARLKRVSLLAAWSLTAASATAIADDEPAVSTAAPIPLVQVTVPLQLDYPLLEKLLIAQAFKGSGGSLELLADPSGCSEILLSNPSFASRVPQLELLADTRARIGIRGVSGCATVFTFQGRIGISGSPELRDNGTEVGFVPDRVWLLDAAGEPVGNPNLQSLADAGVHSVVSRFHVDLKPQLQSIGDFLPDVLPGHSRQQIDALLETLRLSSLQPREETLDAELNFSIEPLAEPLTPERALTDAELTRWEERWQLMDSLLVLAVKRYAATTQLQELRDALLEALIESRYRLRDALVETPDTGSDLVRDWFLQSWQSLAPVVRRIGLEQPGQEHLLLLSVIAATDALEALDKLGPGMGLDISTDGLRRLARMITGSDGAGLLPYSEAVDPELRRLLDESLGRTPPPAAWRFRLSPFPDAVAADRGRLNSWAPKRNDLPEYLPLVAELLDASAKDASGSRNLDSTYRELFRQIVLTTAWQESCWRHYVVSDDRKLVPLRSGTGDVGLMQVNERVWRGFYDQHRLRWDIDYNSESGAEVLVDYLVKYAIRKGEHRQPGGLSNLARATYSAYNGGPSQLARYRRTDASTYGKKVDTAFWEKYQQVAAGNELAVSGCLGGNLSGPALAAGEAAISSNTTQANPAGVDSGTRLTLQLGAFSSEAAARQFIRQNALSDRASVRQHGKDNRIQYLVTYGDFATRAEAEATRRTLARLDSWIRQLKDL